MQLTHGFRRHGAALALAVLAACGAPDASTEGTAASAGTDPSAALGPLDPIDGPSWAPDRIAVGDVAPDFRLESYRGDTLQLTDYRGEREVILVFYRGSW